MGIAICRKSSLVEFKEAPGLALKSLLLLVKLELSAIK